MLENQEKEKTKDLICNYLKQGMFKKDAAIMSGIDESTFYRWIESDASFASRVEASILEYKLSLIKNINICAEKDGRLALEVLRRRFPDTDAKIENAEESERSIKQIADSIQQLIEENHQELHS